MEKQPVGNEYRDNGHLGEKLRGGKEAPRVEPHEPDAEDNKNEKSEPHEPADQADQFEFPAGD